MATLIRGDLLPERLRRQVLESYLYRWTSDNPHRARAYGVCPHCGVAGGLPEPTLQDAARMPCRQVHPVVALQTDEEWLAGHCFKVTRDGRLCGRYAEPACLEGAGR